MGGVVGLDADERADDQNTDDAGEPCGGGSDECFHGAGGTIRVGDGQRVLAEGPKLAFEDDQGGTRSGDGDEQDPGPLAR